MGERPVPAVSVRIVVAWATGIRTETTRRVRVTRTDQDGPAVAPRPDLTCSWRLPRPVLPDGVGTGLADVDPVGDVDALDVELEDRLVLEALDHPSDVTPSDDGSDDGRRRGVRGDVGRHGADAELVVVGPGRGVDDAAPIAAQVPSLRGPERDRGEEPTISEDRTEGVQARRAVPADRRQVGDGEDVLSGGNRLPAIERDESGPQSRRHGGDLGCLAVDHRPSSHSDSLAAPLCVVVRPERIPALRRAPCSAAPETTRRARHICARSTATSANPSGGP